MVCEFGMNAKLGPRTFGRRDREVFLGRDFVRERNYSEQTAEQIDQEIHKIISNCYQQAVSLLKRNRERLKRLALALLEREVLDGEEVNRLLKGRPAAGVAVPIAARSVNKDA